MKYLRKLVGLSYMIFMFLSFSVNAQNTKTLDASDDKLIKAAKEIMTAAGTCALITLDEDGLPRVRAMSPFLPENDLTVWFGTNPKSRKVVQIKKDSRVILYYLDSDASGYVTIHGTAQLVDDQKEKDKRWKDEWNDFYANKKEAYLLIKVTPKWLEVSSVKRGIFSDSLTWQPPVVKFDSDK